MSIQISFILPVYNVESYLADAIESILKQNISKEIILVDDGSTDNSLAIALNYANKFPFIYVIHSQNKGVGAARNAGLRFAKGEYILLLDPDDTLDESLDLNIVYQLAKQHNVPVIKGQFTNYFEETPSKIYYNSPTNPSVNKQTYIIQSLSTFWDNALKNGFFIPNACFLFLRKFVMENNLAFPEHISVGEDGVFNINLFLCEGSILELHYFFFNYRLNQKSTMGKAISAHRLCSFLNCIALFESYKKKTDSSHIIKLLDATIALHRFYFHRDIQNASEEVREPFKKFITPEFIQSYERFGIKGVSKEFTETTNPSL